METRCTSSRAALFTALAHSPERVGRLGRGVHTHILRTCVYIYIFMYTARALTNDRAGKIKQRVRDKTSSHIGSISRGRGILLYYIILLSFLFWLGV